jgi:hypothetical protein
MQRLRRGEGRKPRGGAAFENVGRRDAADGAVEANAVLVIDKTRDQSARLIE